MTPATAHATSAAPEPAVPFRQVLLLCLPALIVGLVFRISFLVAIPEIYYGADSNSYFEGAWKLWTQGDFTLNPKRRFFYPILLMFMPLLPGSTAVGTAVVQHLLGLIIIVGIGWIVAQITRLPYLWVPLVTCAAAVWPRMLWFEHEMIAEVWLLAAFVAAVAIAVPCGSLKNPRRMFWFLVAAAAIVACKPHGRPIWLGLMVMAVAMAGNPLKWEKKSLAVVAFAALIILTSGSGQQGSWLFLNSTLPFVQTAGEPYAEYRAILRPLVEKARANLPNYASQQSRYKKVLNGSRPDLGEEWPKLAKNKKLYQKVATRLAIEGVIQHPIEYAQLVLRKIAAASSNMSPGKVSPATFWAAQERNNEGRMQRPTELELVYGMPISDYRTLVAERRSETTWLTSALEELSRVVNWTRYRQGAPGEAPYIGLTLLGWLLALGLLACLAPRHFICRALLWFPVAIYLFAIFGVGDAVRRYLHPVEWVGLVIVAIGLDSVATLLIDAFGRLRHGSTPADLPTPNATGNISLGGLLPGAANSDNEAMHG
jgi:hypothetical protein